MFRRQLTGVARAARPAGRRYASTVEGGDYAAEKAAVKAHALETTDLWRKISLYVCIPATLVCVAWVRNVEGEHEEHLEHIKEENGGEMPPTPEYPYLNKRGKPFPWGMNTLFFNPHTNKDMSDA